MTPFEQGRLAYQQGLPAGEGEHAAGWRAGRAAKALGDAKRALETALRATGEAIPPHQRLAIRRMASDLGEYQDLFEERKD